MENILIGITGLIVAIVGAIIAGFIASLIVGINTKIGETKKGNLVVFFITAIITFIIIVSQIKWA
jgi:hypothetical protein